MPAPSIFPNEVDVIGALPFIRRISAAALYLEQLGPVLLWPDLFADTANLTAEWVVERREHKQVWDLVNACADPPGTTNVQLDEIRRNIRMDAMRRLDMSLFGSETFDPQSLWGGDTFIPKVLKSIKDKRVTIKVGASKTQKLGYPPDYEKVFTRFLCSDVVDEIEQYLWPLRSAQETESETLEKWQSWKDMEALRQWEKTNNLPSCPVHLRIIEQYLPDGYTMAFSEAELDSEQFPLTSLLTWKLPIVWSKTFQTAWERRPDEIRKWEKTASPEEVFLKLKTLYSNT